MVIGVISSILYVPIISILVYSFDCGIKSFGIAFFAQNLLVFISLLVYIS